MRLLWNFVKPILELLPPEAYVRVRRSMLSCAANFGYTNSQGRMDKRLHALVGGKKQGVFVEAGAADGLDQSNTLYLERCHGWRGLLVEPVSEQVAACRRYRRGSKVEHAVLGRPEDSGKTFHILPAALQSIVQESAAHTTTDFDGHVARANPGEGETCPVATLTELLLKHGLTEVDVFSLDVEGAEMMVLEGLDTDKIKLGYLLVETNDVDALEAYGKPRGWELVGQWKSNDYLFKIS